jgi:hypothetical protein
MQWFVINCGQLERAFSNLMPRRLATEIVDALGRGESVEFPGLYREDQFDSGFHYQWSPVSSDLPPSFSYVGHLEAPIARANGLTAALSLRSMGVMDRTTVQNLIKGASEGVISIFPGKHSRQEKHIQ